MSDRCTSITCSDEFKGLNVRERVGEVHSDFLYISRTGCISQLHDLVRNDCIDRARVVDGCVIPVNTPIMCIPSSRDKEYTIET